jgi:hypothetical protein
MPQVLQITRMKLRPGQSRPFLDWCQRAFDHLCHASGFLGREVLQAEDGTWRLVARWHDPTSLQTAEQAWRIHPLANELERYIEPGSFSTTRLLSLRYDEPEETAFS